MLETLWKLWLIWKKGDMDRWMYDEEADMDKRTGKKSPAWQHRRTRKGCHGPKDRERNPDMDFRTRERTPSSKPGLGKRLS
jgi:hypothetical protein